MNPSSENTDVPQAAVGGPVGFPTAEGPILPPAQGGCRRLWWLRNELWVFYCLPFLVFMVLGTLEPYAPAKGVFPADTGFIQYNMYPYIYTAKVVLVAGALAFCWPAYRRFSGRATWLSVAVGLFGAVVWVGLNKLQQQIDHKFLEDLGLGMLTKLGARSGFNPLRELADQPAWAYTFLGIRLLGLAVIVPIMEEFFLRAFAMRYPIHEDWWTVPFGTLTPLAIAVGIGLPMMMHPQELLASLAWFSLILWLMYRTKSIWQCVVAHGVTNFAMGMWVLYSGDWWLM